MYFTSTVLAALVATAYSQSSSSSSTASSSSSSGSSVTLTGSSTVSAEADYPTGSLATYASYASTLTLEQSYTLISGTSSTSASGNSSFSAYNSTVTTSGSTYTTRVTSATETYLVGSSRTSTNGTASRTSTAARASNTQPCNGYPEFCTRKYSNITMVAAHNSPFDVTGNAASNQMLDVTTQLNDGIRMLQFQVHKPNSTSPLLMCHTSCDILNVGPLVDYLTTVREWLDSNPYEVVTILMGNYDFIDPGNFTAPIYDSGIEKYVYTPPTVPMGLSEWPTLGEMILTQRRVIMMLDYQANQAEIPWLLDEFANMWETPFSPTDPSFPCTQQRPPNQSRNVSEDRMYIANHNLNVNLAIAGISILIPAFTLLNQTNAVSGYGSAGVASQNCTADWNRPPNFILVDYYNIGNFNGSVFQVAADANGVTYNRNSCCGSKAISAAGSLTIGYMGVAMAFGVAALLLL